MRMGLFSFFSKEKKQDLDKGLEKKHGKMFLGNSQKLLSVNLR